MPLWWESLRLASGELRWYVVETKDWFLAREALSALAGTDADPDTATGWRKSELGQHVLRKQRLASK